MYKQYKDPMTNEVVGILRDNGNGTKTSFPLAESNTDYQEYLKWLAEGNEPEPADQTE